jgi:hypothetical protein
MLFASAARKEREHRGRAAKGRSNSTSAISRGVSGIRAAAQANRLRLGLTVFYGSLNQSSRIQQIWFGELRTDQLQTGKRDSLILDRDWDGKSGDTPEIHGLRILQSQRSCLKRNGATKERNTGRQIFERR